MFVKSFFFMHRDNLLGTLSLLSVYHVFYRKGLCEPGLKNMNVLVIPCVVVIERIGSGQYIEI